MIIIYQHRRNDTNDVFYIGIGKNPRRPYVKSNRSKFWLNVINKTSYSVEILTTVDTWEEAVQIEKYLIKFYGRRNLGLGKLVNLTDGGDGCLGMIGGLGSTGRKFSDETKKLMSEQRKGCGNAMYGKNHTAFSKSKMSKNKIGIKFSDEINKTKGLIGGNHPQAKKVIDISNGEIYNCVKDASEKCNINRQTLTGWLNGSYKNKSNLKYLE